MKCQIILYLIITCLEVCFVVSLISDNNKSIRQVQYQREEKTRLRNYGPVIFANILYRHGDRTPFILYSTDPNKNLENWNIGLGQLTKEGEIRHYNLGEWIRNNYKGLIGPNYNYKDIYILSSDADRCIMSAQCNLAGLYPINKTSSIPSFQPIPIHTIPQNLDKMIYLNAICPAYDLEIKQWKDSLEPTYNIKYKQLFENLTKHTGDNITDINEASLIFDVLKVEKEMGLKIPEWTELYYPEPLKTVSRESFLYRTKTEFMKRIKGGPLLTDMVNHMLMKVNGTLEPDRKLWIYSGHDDTLITLLDTLHLYSESMPLPPYATMLALQLRHKENQFYVTIMYKDGDNDTAIELTMKGCNRMSCTLERFIQLIKPMMITDEEWNDVCKLKISTITYQGAITMGWPVLLVVSIGMGCLVFIYCKYFRLRNVKYYYKLKTEPE